MNRVRMLAFGRRHMTSELTKCKQELASEGKTINITLNLDRLRDQLTNRLGAIVQRVAVALHSINLSADGSVLLEDVSYRVIFGQEPVITEGTKLDCRNWLVANGLRDGIETIICFLEDVLFIARMQLRVQTVLVQREMEFTPC